MIYRRNEWGAWNANISPQPFHTPPQTGWLLDFPLPQSLYGQRSVVRWRHNKFSRMDRLPNFLNHGAPLKTPHQRLHACVHTRKNKKQTNKTKKIGCKISFPTFFYSCTYMELMVGQEVLTLTGLILIIYWVINHTSRLLEWHHWLLLKTTYYTFTVSLIFWMHIFFCFPYCNCLRNLF